MKKVRLWSVKDLHKTLPLAIYAGVAAVFIGVVAFTLSWNLWEFWGGPLPGFQVLLFPGNLTLVYVWHPLFTEEINFWPKLVLLLIGQFVVVSCVVGVLADITKKLCVYSR